MQYFGFDDDREYCYIVMERCERSLKDGLNQLPDIWEATQQLTCALEVVHGFGYAHRLHTFLEEWTCLIVPCVLAVI